MNKLLLIIGRPYSAKSTYVAQFYTRLQKKKSKLYFYQPVEDITAIKEAREALSKGEETTTTPPEKNAEIMLPIQVGEERVIIKYPDYGGEQINKIILLREIDNKWEKAIKESNHWLLFIRITNLTSESDLSKKTVTDEIISDKKEKSDVEYQISDQSFLIELLQIFLNSKGYNFHLKNAEIKLTIVLTCWDELKTQEKPIQIMSKNLPLLLEFVKTNWDTNYLKIVGLSPQGFSLNDAANKEKYQLYGSENYGYYINKDGKKSDDITELILDAL
jgi:hypothetical protein